MQSTSTCPSCGRHAGPYEACPYCGARLQPRITLRVFRYASLLVAVLGLAVLWFFSVRAPVPTLKIGQAQATMNFAYVRLVGRVVRSPSYDPAGGYLSFWVEDDSGQMLVSAYRSTTQALAQAGKWPDVGDQVRLEGTLRIREDSPALTLAAAETLHILHPEPAVYAIGDISAQDALAAVQVRGLVRQVTQPYEGLTLITLRDQTGAIDVAVSESVQAMRGDVPELQAGDSVELVAAVTLYGDTPQLALTAYGRLTRLDETIEIAPLTRVRDLEDGRVGGFARIEGELVELKPFSAGVKLIVDDGSGRVPVLVWSDVYQALADRAGLVEGARVSAQGEISPYRGQMELVAESPADVGLLAGSMTERVSPQPVAQVADAQPGQAVAISGMLLESRRLSGGLRLVVGDETGRLAVLIWDDVLSKMPDRDRLEVGARLALQGQVEVYRGEVELVLRQPTDLIVAGPTPEAVALAATSSPQAGGVALTHTPTPTFTLVAPTHTPTPTITPTRITPTRTPSPTLIPTRIAPTRTPAATPLPASIPIQSVTRDALGQTLTLAGQVVDVTSTSAGYIFVLDDGSGRIDLFVSAGVYAHVERRPGLTVGTRVLASGELKDYKGALEIVPGLGQDVHVLTAGAGPQSPPRPVSSIGQPDEGRFVTIQVSILAVEALSGGLKLRVRDQSGEGDLDVILWDNVKAYVPGADGLLEGASLSVTGKVGFFRGAPQVTPQLGYDVQLVR